MYQYTWYQWLFIFYLYCFLGWIFESAYVSFKKKQLVNRGFLRLPMLPLYGTGAVMMLWVSLPFSKHLSLVFLSGMAASTILEYITGWGMERIFGIRYWDYTGQPFHLNGYICLSSSIAWGVLTLLLTNVIHRPVEYWITNASQSLIFFSTAAVSVLFVYDTVQSVRAALSLAQVLAAMTRIRAELDEIQVQIALLKAETEERLENIKEETAAWLKDKAADRRDTREERIQELSKRLSHLKQRRQQLTCRIDAYHRRILKGNPTAASSRFGAALHELRETVQHKKR